MRKKTRPAPKKAAATRQVHHHAHPKHLGQMEMLLLLVVLIGLLGYVGSVMGLLPSFFQYPKVLSAMVGR